MSRIEMEREDRIIFYFFFFLEKKDYEKKKIIYKSCKAQVQVRNNENRSLAYIRILPSRVIKIRSEIC